MRARRNSASSWRSKSSVSRSWIRQLKKGLDIQSYLPRRERAAASGCHGKRAARNFIIPPGGGRGAGRGGAGSTPISPRGTLSLMARFFNTAGPCDPSRHYMLPPAERLPAIGDLIDRELYFVLHAPRQSGKTTLVRSLAHSLTSQGRYVAVYANCETAQPAGADLERGVSALLEALAAQAERLAPE